MMLVNIPKRDELRRDITTAISHYSNRTMPFGPAGERCLDHRALCFRIGGNEHVGRKTEYYPASDAFRRLDHRKRYGR
jgi:hypothetical protein